MDEKYKVKLNETYKDCLLNGKEIARNYTDILLSGNRNNLVFSLNARWG